MFWVNTKRITRAGFANFWRNGFVSLSSVLIMIVTLFVISAILFSNTILTSSLEQIKNRVDINVYFVATASQNDVLAIKKTLEGLPEVLRVEYLSREDALTAFKKKHENDQLTLQALNELGDNPLGAVLNVKAKEPSQYEAVARFLQGKDALSQGGTSIIDKVNYFQNKDSIDKLTHIIDSGQKLGLAATIILIVISILITLNTIRLAIYTSREEISVMQLVGASNKYIRGPFVVSGVMYGVVSSLITLLILLPLTFWLGPRTENFFTGLNLFDYYLTNFGQLLLILLASGVTVGSLSSYLAVKRYLKV